MESEVILEYADSRGARLRVNRQTGVISGVKVLGQESRNGRFYPPRTLRSAAPLYEGSKVNVNHPKGSPGGPRDYQDRMGMIRGVRLGEGDSGLYADLHANPAHALFEQLCWDAEHAPENVGFSHNVEAKTSHKGGKTVVEEIVKVQSVDLVADPATTRGLFEETDSAAAKKLKSEETVNITDGPSAAAFLKRQPPQRLDARKMREIAGAPVSREDLAAAANRKLVDSVTDATSFARAIRGGRLSENDKGKLGEALDVSAPRRAKPRNTFLEEIV
jgi:hypothetical protein